MSSRVDPQYQTIHLVVENWEEAKRRAPEEALAEKLLKHLFELEPQTREVFGVKRSLFGSKNHDVAVLHVTKMLLFLDTVLTMEGEPDALFALLKDVGRRHRTYGVKANFVPLMGKALILALKETYGTQFTVAHEDAWEQVLKILNGNIIKGMATES